MQTVKDKQEKMNHFMECIVKKRLQGEPNIIRMLQDILNGNVPIKTELKVQKQKKSLNDVLE